MRPPSFSDRRRIHVLAALAAAAAILALVWLPWAARILLPVLGGLLGTLYARRVWRYMRARIDRRNVLILYFSDSAVYVFLIGLFLLANAKLATFNGPKGIAVDDRQQVFVVDTENQVIRRIDTEKQQADTVAGSGGRGFGGDSGPARLASMARPHGICVGPDGSLFIGDTENHRVRRVRWNQP